MLALTLIQPWAYAVGYLGKDIENRSWLPPKKVIGERIAIHAGSRRSAADIEALREAGFKLPDKPLAGAIIATARVAGWVQTEGSRFRHSGTLAPDVVLAAIRSAWYEPECVGWVLVDVELLRKPVPYKGALGLWRAPI